MTAARSNSVTQGEIEFHHTWSRVQGALLTRHAVEFDEPYVWDLIGNVVPFQGDGVGDFTTQGGASRLRRCALPRAIM